jgi:radical SAM superfamily enzyme YgiQ (UPF0313 family)
MRVVLTQAHKSWRFATNNLVIPNSLLYIGASLEKAGHEVVLIDPLVHDLSLQELMAKIKAARPDLVGLYMTTDSRFRAFELIAEVKRSLGVPVMAGGPHPSFCADDTLKHAEGLDIIVRGEGDRSAAEVADALARGAVDLGHIPNVSFKRGREVVHNKEFSVVEDLDTLPFPAYHLIDLDSYRFFLPVPGQGLKKAVPVFSGRGCPQGCIFCASTHLWQRKVRTLSTGRLLEQIDMLKGAYGIEYVAFFDDTFNISRGRLEQFCREAIDRKLGIFWDAQIRATNVDEDLLRLMQAAGCVEICFGIESGNEYVRNSVISKNISNENIYKLDETAHAIGLSCGVNFMVSFPGETKQQADDTFRMIGRLKSKIFINMTKIYPGTRLEAIAKEKGILKPGFRWSDPKGYKKYAPLYLPGLFGDIPFYKEKLSYAYIFEKFFEITQSDRWGLDKKKFSLTRLLKKYLSSIDYYRDLVMLFFIGIGFIRWKVKKIANRGAH